MFQYYSYNFEEPADLPTLLGGRQFVRECDVVSLIHFIAKERNRHRPGDADVVGEAAVLIREHFRSSGWTCEEDSIKRSV